MTNIDNSKVELHEDSQKNEEIKTELKNLASTIDVREKDFSPIDNLLGKLNTIPEEKKNLALQYALKETPIKIGNGGEKKLGEIARLFDKAVEQDGNTWKIKLKENVELSDEDTRILQPFLNEKESSLAYLIQKASNFAKVEAQKGYGQEADKLVDIGVDSILGNQTRRALSGLKSWIESDLTTMDDDKIKNLTPEEVLAMNFIPKDLKEKIEASDNEAIKSLWANEKYEIRNPYTNNWALKGQGPQQIDGEVQLKTKTIEIGGVKHEVIKITSLDDLPKDANEEHIWNDTPKKVYIMTINNKEYTFYDNWRCYDWSRTHNTKDIVANTKRLKEKQNSKKENLVKGFWLKENWSDYYTRDGYQWLYSFGQDGKLYYAWNDYWCLVFLWGKEDNWKKIKSEELPSLDFLRVATVESLQLEEISDNLYKKEGYKGQYAFDSKGILYYSGIDYGNQKFLWLQKKDGRFAANFSPSKQRENITDIPDDIDYISV